MSKVQKPAIENNVPNLVISEATASEFMKEITGVPIDVTPKQNAFLDKLVKDVTKPPRPPRTKTVVREEKAVAKPSDEPSSKAALISKISINVNSFMPLLRDYVKPSKEEFLHALPKKTVADLEILLKTLEHARTVGNAANQLKHLVFIGATAVEVASKRFGMRSEGYAQALQAQEDEIKMILQEIAMERVESFTKFQRPEVRLAVLLSTTLLSLDNANRLADLRKETDSQKVAPLVEEQYRDL